MSAKTPDDLVISEEDYRAALWSAPFLAREADAPPPDDAA